ncbi:MAG TPA: polyhydroxyalkanoic acid synthase subunit PhaR [Bacillota bacterium]|nr:polyhydroxyalkanoic acid synthase subunit PhaR [Bacillota bacterium]
MTQQMSFDPFALWKQMYDKMEEQWSQTIDESMHKEDFSQWMGQCLNGYLQYQDMARKSTEKYLEQANMPSRQDLSSVASMVINIEEKIDNLEQTIEEDILDNLKQLDAVKEIKSLKTEMGRLSKKMDQIVDLLQANRETAITLSTPVEDVIPPTEVKTKDID